MDLHQSKQAKHVGRHDPHRVEELVHHRSVPSSTFSKDTQVRHTFEQEKVQERWTDEIGNKNLHRFISKRRASTHDSRMARAAVRRPRTTMAKVGAGPNCGVGSTSRRIYAGGIL